MKLEQKQLELKQQIAKLNVELTSVNEQIAKMSGHNAEGSKTLNDGKHKATITNVMNRTLNKKDFNAFVDSGKSIDPKWHHLIEWTPKLNQNVMKEIESSDPETLAIISEFVTSKPGKVQVKVEEVE